MSHRFFARKGTGSEGKAVDVRHLLPSFRVREEEAAKGAALRV
jgi:hypothetical protein